MKDPKFVEDAWIVLLIGAAALMLQGYALKLVLLA